MMMGNRTQENPENKQNQTNQARPQPKQHQKARGRFPIIQTVFPLYGGETSEKVGCILTKGLNSQRGMSKKSVHERRASEANQRGFVQSSSRDHTATASSGKTWYSSISPGAHLTVSSTDSCLRKSVVAKLGKPRKNPVSQHNPYT